MGVGGSIHLNYQELTTKFPKAGLQIKKHEETVVSPEDVLEGIVDFLHEDLEVDVMKGALKFELGAKEFFFSIPRGKEWNRKSIMEEVKGFLEVKGFFK